MDPLFNVHNNVRAKITCLVFENCSPSFSSLPLISNPGAVYQPSQLHGNIWVITPASLCWLVQFLGKALCGPGYNSVDKFECKLLQKSIFIQRNTTKLFIAKRRKYTQTVPAQNLLLPALICCKIHLPRPRPLNCHQSFILNRLSALLPTQNLMTVSHLEYNDRIATAGALAGSLYPGP